MLPSGLVELDLRPPATAPVTGSPDAARAASVAEVRDLRSPAGQRGAFEAVPAGIERPSLGLDVLGKHR